jgi:hypothetical protein
VRATDTEGDTDATPAAFAWTNGKVPKAKITGKPPSLTNAGAVFTFTSSDPGGRFGCSLDGGAFAACASPTAYRDLADGKHSFAVKAIDAANRAGNAAKASWTLDVTPPVTTIVKHPVDPTSSTTADFTLASSESKSTFQCSLDGGAFRACKQTVKYKVLAIGAHTFSARAIDRAGNTGSAATWAWTVTA